MTRKFRATNPDQLFLLPPSLRDWLPEGHLAYFIQDVVAQLDLSEVYAAYEGDGRGQPPYDPTMMTALLFYAYCVGVPSSRKIERRTYEDVAFRVVADNQHPDHDSIRAFRKRHLRALEVLFVQVLQLCARVGLAKLGHVAIDGTKIKANASKHKAMSYGRMKEKKAVLEREVAELLERAEQADAADEKLYGKGRRGDDLPKELQRRQHRLEKIEEAMHALEAEAQAEAQAEAAAARAQPTADVLAHPETPTPAEAQRREPPRAPKPRGRPPKRPTVKPGTPPDTAQRNFTDPDSRIMRDGATKSFEQCYNAQAAVDATCQVIVAAELTQAANDMGQLKPLLTQVEANLGSLPTKVSADAGYGSEDNIGVAEDAGVDAYLAVEKMKHGSVPPAARGRPPKNLSPKERMRRKLHSKRGRVIYAKRKAIVEPVFGQIKEVRGLRRFLLRGFDNVRAEWQLWCLTHNLLKLFRSGAFASGVA